MKRNSKWFRGFTVGVISFLLAAALYAGVKKYTVNSKLNEDISVKQEKIPYPVVTDYGKLITADEGKLVFRDAEGIIRVLDQGTFGSTSWKINEYYPQKVSPPK